MDNAITIIDILAWPLTVLVMVWIVRKQLLSLILSIQRIKFRGAEIEFFSRSLQQTIDSMLQDADVEINKEPSDARLYDALKRSPDHTVLEAWNALEKSAREKAENLVPADESFENPLGRPLDYLEFKGALTPTTAGAIRDLRSLRNQVVHFGEGVVVREDAIRYVGVAERIMKVIDGVTELPKVKLTAMTLLILELNSLIDSRPHDDVPIKEVCEWVRNNSVIPYLAKRFEGHIDVSMYGVDGPYQNFAEFYHEQLKQIYDAYGAGRKWGVENSGLCLLLAWTNELIQQGSGWHPNEI